MGFVLTRYLSDVAVVSKFVKHPGGLSSLMFSFAALVIHRYGFCSRRHESFVDMRRFTQLVFSGRPIMIGISMRPRHMLIWHPCMEIARRIKTKSDFAMAVGFYTQMSSQKTGCYFYPQEFVFCSCSSTGTTTFVYFSPLRLFSIY